MARSTIVLIVLSLVLTGAVFAQVAVPNSDVPAGNIRQGLMAPQADHDGDGVPNHLDPDFLKAYNPRWKTNATVTPETTTQAVTSAVTPGNCPNNGQGRGFGDGTQPRPRDGTGFGAQKGARQGQGRRQRRRQNGNSVSQPQRVAPTP